VNSFIVGAGSRPENPYRTREVVMAVNASIGRVGTGAWEGASRSLGSALTRPLGAARRGARGALAYFAQDAVTAREHRRRGIYEATGFQRGEQPRSEDVAFDLVDRYRAGL
jgi:hypothetical protein